MACKMRVVSGWIVPAAAVAGLVVVVLGCSESSPGNREVPATGSASQTSAESGAGSDERAAADSGGGGGESGSVSGGDAPESVSDAATAADGGSQNADSDTDGPTGVESGVESGSGTGTLKEPVIDLEPIASTPREDVPSALRDRRHPDHPEPLIDLSEILSGGPPPDGIPPLEDPAFEPAGEVDWLPGLEPVLALEINGDARAYPLRIMTWHELVNGAVGGVPVTVSYCPLCNSAVAYDRRVGERILDFGTSGELFNSSLVMYDRQTESLWSHYTGQAVVGHLTGAELDLIPVQTVSFESFLSAHPEGHVLSLDTGHSRRYGQNPYEFYDTSSRPFLFGGPFDDRLEPMTRVLALRAGDEGAVIPLDVLAERRVVPFSFAGRELVALYESGTASALDAGEIAEGRDVGATGVFVRSLGGQPLDLSVSADGGFVDASTGVAYDILGRPSDSSGPGALEPVEHLDTFWFAAAAFYSDAEIIGL